MKNNGSKTFLFVIRHEHQHGVSTYLMRADRAPSAEELVSLLDLDFEPEAGEALEAIRYSEDEIPTLPPKAKAL